MKNYKAEIIGAVARGWCHKENEHKVMDSDLAMAIVEEVLPVIREIAQEATPKKRKVDAVMPAEVRWMTDGYNDCIFEILSNVEELIK